MKTDILPRVHPKARNVQTGPQWYDGPRYERARFEELRPGDVICFPGHVADGHPWDWKLRSLVVERVEEKAPGVWFIYRAEGEQPLPWYDRFAMVGGQMLTAGALRKVRPAVSLAKAA